MRASVSPQPPPLASPHPWALTDRPAKQPISAGDASARRLLLPVYQSPASTTAASAKRTKPPQLSIHPPLRPLTFDDDDIDSLGSASASASRPPSRSPIGYNRSRSASRLSVGSFATAAVMEGEEGEGEGEDGMLLLPPPVVPRRRSQQSQQGGVRYGVPSESESESESEEEEEYDHDQDEEQQQQQQQRQAVGYGNGNGHALPLPSTAVAAAASVDEDGGMVVVEGEEEGEAAAGGVGVGVEGEEALAGLRLRRALKAAGAAAAAEYEEGWAAACAQMGGLSLVGGRPSLTPSADGGGEGVQLGGRLAEEEERRVREDRQRMFALLATEAQEREAVEAALRALHHAISAAPHAPLNLTDLQRLLDAEPLARARAARGAEGEGAEMIPPAEAGAFGVLEAAEGVEDALSGAMGQWAAAVARASAAGAGGDEAGAERLKAAAEGVLEALQSLPGELLALLPRLDPGSDPEGRWAALGRLRREQGRIEEAARYEKAAAAPPQPQQPPPAAQQQAPTATAAATAAAAGAAAASASGAGGMDPLKEARAAVGKWAAFVASVAGGEARAEADLKRHEDALSNYLGHLKTTRASIGVVMRQGRLQSDAQPSLLDYLRTGGSAQAVDLPQRFLAYRAFFRAVVGEAGKGPLCHSDKFGRKGVSELWIVMYAQMLLAPAALFPETLPLPGSSPSELSMGDVLWAAFHDLACPSAIPDPNDGNSLRLSGEARASIQGDIAKRLSTVTFQNQFNVSSKDYWYMKKPARALRLLAQMMLTVATPVNALRFQRTLESWASPPMIQTARASPPRLPFDGDTLWAWLVAYLKALVKKHEARSGLILPDLLLLSAFLGHDLPAAFLDLGPPNAGGNQRSGGTVFGARGGGGGGGGGGGVDPWSHFKDEWDKEYLNEHEPMAGVLSTLLEKHGPARLAVLCKLIMSEGYGKPLAWHLQHRHDLNKHFQPWEMAAGRSIGYNVDDLLPDNLLPPPRTGVPPRVPCFCLAPGGCPEPAQFFDAGLEPLPVPAYCARHKPPAALDRYQGMKALRDELNLKPGCAFPRVPSLAPPASGAGGGSN